MFTKDAANVAEQPFFNHKKTRSSAHLFETEDLKAGWLADNIIEGQQAR
jgi:hypothetical protein